MDKVHVEKTMLDGRLAERHTSFNKDGDKIVEIFAEEKRPLHLEKRVIQKHKQIVAEERTEYVRDGEVVEVEVKAVDAPVQMQMREHLGVVDHAKFVDGDYVKKSELGPVVTDAVVTGVATLMENFEFAPQSVQAPAMVAPIAAPPVYQAQQQIAERVSMTADNDKLVNWVLIGLIVAQLGFGFWVFFM